MTERRQDGLTLIEVMVVVSLMAIVLNAVFGTVLTVNQTADANSRGAESVAEARRTMRRIGDFLRPGKMSSFAAQAVAADVAAVPARATAVGEWIPPSALVWRPGIRFVSAEGLLSMNAALSTSPREITFNLDANELDNDLDDDGDGLVDEGSISLLHDLSTVAMVSNVEDCAFLFDGRLLVVRIALAKSDRRGRVYRSQFEQAFYLRNN